MSYLVITNQPFITRDILTGIMNTYKKESQIKWRTGEMDPSWQRDEMSHSTTSISTSVSTTHTSPFNTDNI